MFVYFTFLNSNEDLFYTLIKVIIHLHDDAKCDNPFK